MLFKNTHFQYSDHPRFLIKITNGKTECGTDLKNDRFGSVFPDGEQGRHLFANSYFLSSLAVSYNDRTFVDVATDITQFYHKKMLIKLFINSLFRRAGKATVFADNRKDYVSNLLEAHGELCELLKKPQATSDQQVDSLEYYLNFVGAIQYILPCNVAYAKDAKDPHGGVKARTARANFRSENKRALQAVIKDIIDIKVIRAFFDKGFDENNHFCLAFIILQMDEFLSSASEASTLHWIDALKGLRDIVFACAYFSELRLNYDSYCTAYGKALDILKKARSFVEQHSASPQVLKTHLA